MSEADLKEEVIRAIKTVYDPEIPVDVYELGLIYDLKVFPINNVFVSMTLTSTPLAAISPRSPSPQTLIAALLPQ